MISQCCQNNSLMIPKSGQVTTRHDPTRPDTTRQDNTRKESTRQNKTRQDKTRPDKTRQGKTRQAKNKPEQTRQDRTRRVPDRFTLERRSRLTEPSMQRLQMCHCMTILLCPLHDNLRPPKWLKRDHDGSPHNSGCCTD